jgi:ribonuclease HI
MKFVYTDGASSNNGKLNCRAGYGIFFSKDDPRNVSKQVSDFCIGGKYREGNERIQTNNVAELMGVIECIHILGDSVSEYIIYTDSNYVILCATAFGCKEEMRNWKKTKNRWLVRELYELVSQKKVNLRHIEAHTGNTDQHSLGNREADMLAVMAIKENNYKDGEDDKNDKSKITKIFLNVPYCDKDIAKSLGAKWDPTKKKWWCYENILERFEKWQI